jgi:hypothetical protein
MTEEFHLDGDGLSPFSNLHDEVATGLSQLTGPGAPVAAEVASTFGNIAFGVNTALDATSQSRLDTFGATRTAGDTISALLQEANRRYAAGDQAGADSLRSAAAAMQNDVEGQTSGTSGGAAGGPSVTSGGGSGGGSGGSGGGEMIGQIGQQVGQAVTQGVSGATQGLSQIPQQIAQSVQGLVQAVSGAGGAETSAETAAESAAKSAEPGAAQGDQATAGLAPDQREGDQQPPSGQLPAIEL